MLTVADHVRNLLGEYCRRIDGGDFDGVGELFEHGRLATEDGTVLASGAGEVAAFYRSATRLHDGSPGTKHLVSGTVLSVDGDVVEARSSYLVLQAVPGLVALQPIVAGRYVDTFSVHGGGPEGVRWVERRFVVDLAGDLAQHLTFSLPGS